MIKHHIIWDRYKDDPFEPFDVPGLPHPLRISMARMPWLLTAPGWEGFLEEIVESEATTDGVVINSFDDLERVYVDCYSGNMEGKKVWTLGPLSLVHKDPDNKAARDLQFITGFTAGCSSESCLGSCLQSSDQQMDHHQGKAMDQLIRFSSHEFDLSARLQANFSLI
ncbi:hypothetical protein Cni_G20812 [Canna indica]|uniref:Uncharacterized protein n=1 Tax=Canna indica TaxID=4628 RepID=A0AAQ3KNA7_9LILI|nr:hypothetical protein Cni_G20812 [Canna indica]